MSEISKNATEKKVPPYVETKEPVFSGKWIKLTNYHYRDEKNKLRTWETLERTTHNVYREVDAVEILAILKNYQGSNLNYLIAIREYRPPAEAYMIELPAGLVDEKEPISVAALRELKEETGFSGKLVHESVPMLFGGAVSSTTSKTVVIEVDGSLPENQSPQQHLEDGEFVEVLLLPINSILEKLQELCKQGNKIDGKLWTVAYMLFQGYQLMTSN